MFANKWAAQDPLQRYSGELGPALGEALGIEVGILGDILGIEVGILGDILGDSLDKLGDILGAVDVGAAVTPGQLVGLLTLVKSQIVFSIHSIAEATLLEV